MYVRESFPRQVDKESRGPQGERGLEFSRRKKGQTFFYPSLHSLGLYNNNVPGGREDQPHVHGAVAVQAQEGLEELSHVEGQEGQQ